MVMSKIGWGSVRYNILIVMNAFKEFFVCETSQEVIHKENESEEPLLERKLSHPAVVKKLCKHVSENMYQKGADTVRR